ncbi:unnamed protein product [Orchesella dallaii]|uniref:Uncharacterized protein n=1 Tax=Orchesella dallaii TaxID=48710 RepID=A0ABP1R6Y8_9HEXA
MLDVDVTTEKDLDFEYESVQKYKKDFISTRRGIEKVIVAASRHVSPAPSIDSSASQDGAVKRNNKLPKIKLKKFGGKIKEWIGFWSQFRNINKDETLDPSHKFHYLLQAMGEGGKRDVV